MLMILYKIEKIINDGLCLSDKHVHGIRKKNSNCKKKIRVTPKGGNKKISHLLPLTQPSTGIDMMNRKKLYINFVICNFEPATLL